MAKSGLKHIDVGAELTKTEWESEDSHELLHASSFPGSPVERQLFYRDDEHKWYIYNATAWVWLGGGGGMAVHGNEYHDPDFATESALSSHASAATGVHGVGGSTVESASGSQSKVDTHGNLTTAHSAVSAATASRMVVRDASGRAAFAAPTGAGDALIKGTAITDTEHGSRGSGLHTDSHTQNTDKVIKDADADTQIQVEESADEDKIRMDVKGVEAFLLDDAGILTLVKQSAARAYLGTNQSIPNATLTVLNLSTENFDIQSEFNTGTYRYVASKAGIYLIAGAVTYTDLTDQKAGYASILKNGAEYLSLFTRQSRAGADYLATAVLDIAALAVNDYLQLAAWHDLGANANVLAGTARTFLSVIKLA